MPRGRGTHTKAWQDHSGKRFNHWTVLSRAPDRYSRTMWNCRCDCGNERIIASIHFTGGASKSCGCHRRRGEQHQGYKHGQTGKRLYCTWQNMRKRCGNPKNVQYPEYGGRGIYVCERWQKFENFVVDMGEPPSPRHTIDRRDNNGPYSPENCRWATPKEQNLNTRRNRMVTLNGVSMPLKAATDMTGVNYGTAKWRLDHGRSDDEALKP